MLAARGLLVLHAGAVARDGAAVLVIGATGAGKSTTVVAAGGAGWTVLADDLVVVRVGEAGVQAHGIARPVSAPAGMGKGTPIAGDARGRYRVEVEHTSGWTPVIAVVVVGHGTASDSRITPIPAQALLDVVPTAFAAAGDAGLLRSALPALASVSRLRGWRLDHGTDELARVAAAPDLLATVVARR
jgi:hypothetical protein